MFTLNKLKNKRSYAFLLIAGLVAVLLAAWSVGYREAAQDKKERAGSSSLPLKPNDNYTYVDSSVSCEQARLTPNDTQLETYCTGWLKAIPHGQKKTQELKIISATQLSRNGVSLDINDLKKLKPNQTRLTLTFPKPIKIAGKPDIKPDYVLTINYVE